MTPTSSLGQRSQATLLALLAIAGGAPVLLGATSPSWVPDWLGAAIAVAALFGALLEFRRTGALRLGYVLLFAIALAVAALAGHFLARA